MIIEGDSKVIAAAYVKARKEMNATVKEEGSGVYGKYATLAAIVEATKTAFANNGLAALQEAYVNESGVCVDTWIIHESGATMHFAALPMPLTDRKPQAVGSAITYARRYQLAAVCGLAPDDDDGQAAQDAASRAQSTQTRTLAPQPALKVHATNGAGKAPQRASTTPEGDVLFAAKPPPPGDAELEILGLWHTRQEAEAWAVEVGACENEYEARNSMNKIIHELGGKVTKENVAAVYLLFLRHQMGKMLAA